MSYFVAIPITASSVGTEIKGHHTTVEALLCAEEMSARYPLVIVAEDFGQGTRMGLVKVFCMTSERGVALDKYVRGILVEYAGCWTAILELRARQKVLSLDAERSRRFIGPRPKPKRYYLYAIDAGQNVVDAENTGCDTEEEARKLLSDLASRFPSVVVVDANHGSSEGPYPLFVAGEVDPGLVYDLFTFGRSMRDDDQIEVASVA
jgi:hypothetical protein